MNVLSLFDGMSCGQIALNRAGISYSSYFACEIDKYAIKVTQANYPNTIQLGDVTKVDFRSLSKIDLLIGGSPCQGFSFAGKQLNFDDPRSALFFEYVRALKECKPKYFLLENVKMKKEFQDIISEHLGVGPILINSSLVSAQNRQRLYWTNIPGITQPEDRGIFLKDIIEDGEVDREKGHCLNANYFKGGNLKSYFEKHRQQLVFSKDKLCHVGDADIKGNDSIKRVYHAEGKCPTLTTMGGGHREPKILTGDFCVKNKSQTVLATIYKENPKSMLKRNKMGLVIGNDNDGLRWRKLTPLECERLQTVPDNFTELKKREVICRANIKIVIDSPELRNMGNIVLSIIKESREMAMLEPLEIIGNIKILNVSIARDRLSPEGFVINITRTGTDIKTLCILRKSEILSVQEGIIGGKMEKQNIESLSKTISNESCEAVKLFTMLIVIKAMIELKTSIFAKGSRSTVFCIGNSKELPENLLRLDISNFKTENIKEIVSNTQRYKMIGNGWTVDVIAHIFKNIK